MDLRGEKGKGEERRGEGKVKGGGGEERMWMEGFGPLKKIGVALPMARSVYVDWSRQRIRL